MIIVTIVRSCLASSNNNNNNNKKEKIRFFTVAKVIANRDVSKERVKNSANRALIFKLKISSGIDTRDAYVA